MPGKERGTFAQGNFRRIDHKLEQGVSRAGEKNLNCPFFFSTFPLHSSQAQPGCCVCVYISPTRPAPGLISSTLTLA